MGGDCGGGVGGRRRRSSSWARLSGSTRCSSCGSGEPLGPPRPHVRRPRRRPARRQVPAQSATRAQRGVDNNGRGRGGRGWSCMGRRWRDVGGGGGHSKSMRVGAFRFSVQRMRCDSQRGYCWRRNKRLRRWQVGILHLCVLLGLQVTCKILVCHCTLIGQAVCQVPVRGITQHHVLCVSPRPWRVARTV